MTLSLKAVVDRIKIYFAENPYFEIEEEVVPEDGLIYFISVKLEIIGCFYDEGRDEIEILIVFKEDNHVIHENAWDYFIQFLKERIRNRLKKIGYEVPFDKIKIILYEDYESIGRGSITDFYLGESS